MKLQLRLTVEVGVQPCETQGFGVRDAPGEHGQRQGAARMDEWLHLTFVVEVVIDGRRCSLPGVPCHTIRIDGQYDRHLDSIGIIELDLPKR